MGNWWVECHARRDHTRAIFGHFATVMLDVDMDALDVSVDVSLGWGSASDQTGMNGLFTELGLPLRYSRAGGASIFLLEPMRSC